MASSSAGTEIKSPETCTAARALAKVAKKPLRSASSENSARIAQKIRGKRQFPSQNSFYLIFHFGTLLLPLNRNSTRYITIPYSVPMLTEIG